MATFYEFVNDLLASQQPVAHEWSDDETTITFKKANNSGFNIELNYDDAHRMLSLMTDTGYHDHFRVEGNENPVDTFTNVLGLIRDLLTRHMRICEIRANDSPRKWQLQAFCKGKWLTEASTGLLFWNYLGKKTHIYYSNDILPPRNLDQ